MKRIVAALAAFGFVVGIAMFAACKQGKGDRCQVTADCQDGLLCSAATGTCVGSGTMNEIDAAVPPIDTIKLDTTTSDSPPADGPVGDAATPDA